MKKFYDEVIGEIVKVVWPSRDEVINATLLVVFLSAVVGAYLGAFDVLFSKILEQIIQK